MTVSGQIWDDTTGDPLNGASVTVVDAANKPTGGGIVADVQGSFIINSPVLDQGGRLMISQVGYNSAIVDPAVILESGGIALQEAPQTLQTAVVTAHKPKANMLPLVLAGGGLLLLASTDKKKRKGSMGAVNVDWQKILVTAGIAGGAYLLVLRPILIKIGILKGPSTAQEQATQQAVDNSLDQAKTQNPLSYTDANYQGWANDIYQQGEENGQDAIVADVNNVRNMTDLLTLIKAFGFRPSTPHWYSSCALLGLSCQNYDLPSYLKLVLDMDHLKTIENHLSSNGIAYTF